MAQIARLAGVSIATVSRTFCFPEKVRPELRERILSICEQHDYVYNVGASDLSRQKTNVIGLLITTPNKSIFGDTLLAIQETSQQYDFISIYGNTLYDRQIEARLLRQFQERRVAGIIFTGFTMGGAQQIRRLMKHKIACVIIWEMLEEPDISYVGFDNFQAAYRATEHLLGLGHRRIGLLVGPHEKAKRARRRLLGYRQALADHGITFDPAIVVSTDPELPKGRQAMGQLLAVRPRPTAVFGAGDRLALGGLAAIKEQGLRVPEDISLVGFGDLEYAAFSDPPLTTVRVPAKEMGTLAVQVLHDLISNGNDGVRQYCLEAELVVRSSTARLG